MLLAAGFDLQLLQCRGTEVESVQNAEVQQWWSWTWHSHCLSCIFSCTSPTHVASPACSFPGLCRFWKTYKVFKLHFDVFSLDVEALRDIPIEGQTNMFELLFDTFGVGVTPQSAPLWVVPWPGPGPLTILGDGAMSTVAPSDSQLETGVLCPVLDDLGVLAIPW